MKRNRWVSRGRPGHVAAAMALAVGLGACDYVPLGTMVQMAGFDPLSASPLGFVVTVDLPEGVDLVPGSEQLRLEARRSDTGEVSDEVYVLDRRGAGAGKVAYRIANQDLARMRKQQALIRGWEDTVPDESNGSLSLSLTPCAKAEVAPKARLSALLTVAEGGKSAPREMRLLNNLPVRKLLPEGLSELPSCNGAS